jgi:hypothetical protein
MSNPESAPPQEISVEEIDFAKYRKPELAERISSMLSIPQLILFALRAARIVMAIIFLVFLLAFGFKTHWTVQIFAYFYGLTMGAVVGGLFGVAATVNRGLSHLTEIFTLILDLTGQVSADAQGLRQGGKQLPPPRKLAAGVYENIVLPMTEQAILAQSRWIGRLLIWAYRYTLGAAVKRLLKYEAQEEATSGAAQPTEVDPALIGATEAAAGATSTWIAATRNVVETIGHGFRRTVMVPVYFIVFIVFVGFSIPATLLWYFAQR